MTLEKLWLKADRYEHDTERWLRSQSKIYALRNNLGMAATFERCADDVEGLRAELAALKAAAGPVVKWWKAVLGPFPHISRPLVDKFNLQYLYAIEVVDGEPVHISVSPAQLDTLARLCGEDK